MSLDAILRLDAAAWAEDVDQLCDAIEQHHPGPFRQLSRDAFQRARRQLRASLDGLPPHARLTELIKLPTLLGDGHTRVLGLDGPGGLSAWLTRLPVELHWYEDGLYVDAAHPDWRDLVGARVTRLGVASSATAMDAATGLVSRENVWRARAVAPGLLTRPALLHGLGIAGLETVDAEFERDGATVRVELPALASDRLADGWPCAPTVRSTLDRWDANVSTFWHGDAFVVKYDRARDEAGGKLSDRFATAFDELDARDARCLVVDLRQNQGGDSRLNWPLIYGILARPRFNRRGALFVLIGRHTFSAAMHGLTALERHTALTCVGEPAGTSPNHFGDAVEHRLERTGLSVGISSLWWQESLPYDTRETVAPEIPVTYRPTDRREGRDPALVAVDDAVAPERDRE